MLASADRGLACREVRSTALHCRASINSTSPDELDSGLMVARSSFNVINENWFYLSGVMASNSHEERLSETGVILTPLNLIWV